MGDKAEVWGTAGRESPAGSMDRDPVESGSEAPILHCTWTHMLIIILQDANVLTRNPFISFSMGIFEEG